jgi:S1-C subfamily serine protease
MELLTYSDQIAGQIGSEYFPGVYINSVGRGTPAERSDIMPGSIITQVNNKEVKNLVDLQLVVEEMPNSTKAIPFLLVDPRGSIEYKAVRP